MERVVLLDTSAIIYRAFYANPHFRTKNEPTGAIYGFVLILQKIIKEFSPKMVGAAFDVTRSSLKRSEIYPEYKAQRDAAPEDLIAQIGRIEELLDAYNIKKFKIDRYEADDVLGTLAVQLSKEGYEVIVITGDKDLSQIVRDNENIKIALLGKADGKDPFKIIKNRDDVKESLGVFPEQIPDFFGLVGDASDGIPGVRKVGPKKAAPMIEKYGTLEGIYSNIDSLTEIPGIGKSLVQNIVEDKEIAFLSRELATIDCGIKEISVTGDDLVYKEDRERLKNIYTELEFKVMLKRFEDDTQNPTLFSSVADDKGKNEIKDEKDSKSAIDTEVTHNKSVINFSDFKRVIVKEIEKKSEKKTDVISYKELEKALEKEGEIVIYLDEYGCSISTKDTDYLISGIKERLSFTDIAKSGSLFFSQEQESHERFSDIFKKDMRIVGYNLKSLVKYDGIKIKDGDCDLLIAHHLLTSSTKPEVEGYAHEHTENNLIKFSEMYPKMKAEQLTESELSDYLCVRSRVLYETAEDVFSKLEEKKLLKLFEEIEMPLITVLGKMEKTGIKIDTKYFKKLNDEFNGKLDNIREEIYLLAGAGEKKEFNINSPKQLAEVLFIDLSLPILKKNKTGPSTDVEVLESLSELGFKIADLLLEHRKLSKLVQTYVEPLPKMVDNNSRIHSSFNQVGTATGRVSSSNPNLQNIPVKSDEGFRIREGFVAESGKKLIGVDYSQIELRVLAEMSEDEHLIKAYRDGKDLHETTARKIFNLQEEDVVSREQRTVAKIVNFSLIYGKTAFGLAKELKIPQKDASSYIKAYFEQYPRVKSFESETIEFAEKHGYVETMFGRKREIEGIISRNKNLKMQGERMAVNTVIQGTAAEVIKKAMINIDREIEKYDDIKLILQVHDELIFEVKADRADYYKDMVEEFMKKAVEFKLSKLDVNGAIGDNWGATK